MIDSLKGWSVIFLDGSTFMGNFDLGEFPNHDHWAWFVIEWRA